MAHLVVRPIENAILNGRSYHISLDMLKTVRAVPDGVWISTNELQDSMADLSYYFEAKKQKILGIEETGLISQN